jgi:shikimate kinase
LHCDVDKLLERTRRDSQRPLLNTQDPKERLESLFDQRKPLYTSIADFTIDTGILQSKDVVTQILDVYESIQN